MTVRVALGRCPLIAGNLTCVETLITWTYTSGGPSRRGSTKTGTILFYFCIYQRECHFTPSTIHAVLIVANFINKYWFGESTCRFLEEISNLW